MNRVMDLDAHLDEQGEGHLDDFRVADLVLGFLGDDDRAEALAHAARCDECAERIRAHVSAQARMAADRPGAAVLQHPATARRASRVWHWLPAAAALIVATVLVVRLPGPRERAVGSVWLPALVEPQLLRGETPLDPHLAAGMDAYARRDLERAGSELSRARAVGPAEQARRLYLAHARFEQGEREQALELLRAVDFAQLPAGVARDGLGLLVRALRATGHGAEADSLERMRLRAPEWLPVRP